MYINSNNSRKIHGLPLRRKHNKRKRFYTRCEAMEAVEDFLNWCDGYKTERRNINARQRRERLKNI